VGSPYVTGPCFAYLGLPAGIAGVIPLPFRPPQGQTTTLTPLPPSAILTPVPSLTPRAPGGPPVGPTIASNPGGGGISSTPSRRLQDFVAFFFRTVRPVYLGTCEDTPQVDFDPAYVPLHQPEFGSTHPSDRLLDGEEGTIVLDLTHYSEWVYFCAAAMGAAGALNRFAPRGTMAEGHTGSLVVAEGVGLPVYLVFPYAAKAVFALNGMPPGYRFFCCVLTSHSLSNLSTKPRKVRLVFRAVRLGVAGTGITGLYDHNVFGLPAPG